MFGMFFETQCRITVIHCINAANCTDFQSEYFMKLINAAKLFCFFIFLDFFVNIVQF